MAEVWYFCPQCPLHADCSKTAWRRADAAATSIEEVRGKVRRHLENSSLHHGITGEVIDSIIDDIDIQEYQDEKHGTHGAWKPAPKPEAAPRARLASAALMNSPPDLSEVVAETIRQMPPVSSSSSTMAGLHGDMIMACEQVERATKAVRQAERLARSAAEAFANEAAGLDQTLTSFRRRCIDIGVQSAAVHRN